MSTAYTLFGGLAVVGAVYYLLRAFRVSNYWAAVIAAGLPIAAYIVYTAGRWPGGDQLAMHLAAYIAAATGLALIGTRSTGATRRLHWAPRALIAFFVVLFFINAALMSIASHGLPPSIARFFLPGERAGATHTAFPGVVAHSQNAAKTVSAELKQRERLAALGWRLRLDGFNGWQAGRAQQLRLTIESATALPSDLAATLELRQSGQPRSVTSARFIALGGGHFAANVMAPAAGSWNAAIEINGGGERLRFEHALLVSPAP